MRSGSGGQAPRADEVTRRVAVGVNIVVVGGIGDTGNAGLGWTAGTV